MLGKLIILFLIPSRKFLKKFEKKWLDLLKTMIRKPSSVRANVPFFLAFIRVYGLNLNEIISWVPIWVAILCFWQMNVILRVKIWVLNKYDLNSMKTKIARGLICIWWVILYDFRFLKLQYERPGAVSANHIFLQIFNQETPDKN